MVAKDKLTAEGGLSEIKTILIWHFNFRTPTVTLPEHKFIAWSAKSQQLISSSKLSKKAPESMIRPMGHVGFVILYHFWSHLQTLLTTAWNRRFIAIQ
jgi:hypothetical protein